MVFVPEDQLSLAIGKDGRNVRLAAQLTGWKIDIKPQAVEAPDEGDEPASVEASASDKSPVDKPAVKAKKAKKSKKEKEEKVEEDKKAE